MSSEAPDSRDRDPAGRPRNARPRDALGRPLPYDSPGVQRAADQAAGTPADEPAGTPADEPAGTPADEPAGTPAEALERAQLLLDAGRPFEAHEVLEDAWKAAPAAERELWRGLAQLAVGLTHAARGNQAGAAALTARGAANLAPFREQPPHRIDVAGLLDWAAGPTDRAAGTGPAVPRLVSPPGSRDVSPPGSR